MANLVDLIEPAIRAALRQADAARVDSAPRSAAPGAGPGLSEDVAARAVDTLKSDPAFDHATNAEPWYRSRVTVGALLSAAAPILGLVGLQLSPESRDVLVAVIVALGGVVGPALTLYGRWAAKTPLGT